MADSAVKPIPEGFHSLTPSLTVRGAADAIEFYKRAFGALEISRAIAPDGQRLWHADLQIGDSRLMLTDEMPEQGSHAPGPEGAVGLSVWLYVEDVDRFGGLMDPFGHHWAIATRKENLSEDEVRRRADAFVASMNAGQAG